MVDSPSDGAPAKAPRWDLADTEGYGGGNCVSGAPWMFSGYIGIYRRKKYVDGCSRGPGDRGRAQEGWARPSISWPPQLLLDLHASPLDHVHSKNHAPEGFIPFGLRLIFLFRETLK